jgi:hypothetical protein
VARKASSVYAFDVEKENQDLKVLTINKVSTRYAPQSKERVSDE